jgi:hypothetical protein
VSGAYLREITIKTISKLFIAKGAVLPYSCRVRVRSQDLVSSVYIILLYQLLFCLIKIFSVWYLLLKCLHCEAGEEILLQVRCWSLGRSIVQMLEL